METPLIKGTDMELTEKLIPMTDYILEHPASFDYEFICGRFLRYAQFLKQTPELWMFVPVGNDGEVLEKPPKEWMERFKDSKQGDFSDWYTACFEYQKALDRCLFKNCSAKRPYPNASYFEVRSNGHLIWLTWNTSKTLEDLTYLELELTDKAI